MRHLQNTIVVLAVTVLTAGAVYSAVTALGATGVADHVVASLSGTSDTTVQTCPATGCSSVGCHATDGGSAIPGMDGASSLPGGGDGSGGGRGGGHGRGGWLPSGSAPIGSDDLADDAQSL